MEIVGMKNLGQMSGFPKYLLWWERQYGQTRPTKCDTANSLEVAQDKLLEHKTGFGFIIEMKAVYQVYRK